MLFNNAIVRLDFFLCEFDSKTSIKRNALYFLCYFPYLLIFLKQEDVVFTPKLDEYARRQDISFWKFGMII